MSLFSSDLTTFVVSTIAMLGLSTELACIQLFQKTLSKEKQSSHKPRPQCSMGSFKSVLIAAVNRELKGNLSTDNGGASDDA